MGVHNRNKQYGFASVKPRDAEVVGGKFNKKKFFIGSGVVILIALVVWGGSAFFNSDLDTKVKIGVTDLLKKEKTASTTEELSSEPLIEVKSANTASVVSAWKYSNTQNVKIALLANPDLFDYNNDTKLGCDSLVFVDKEIKRTPKILNETLKVLFGDQFDYGFPPANFIATQDKLKFDNAVIENGVAKIFLTGETTLKDKECDSKRIGNQIRATAKQFSTVKSVEIYLNGEKTEL
jgi:hypothetical protein